MQTHGGHGKVEFLRQLADGHGAVNQAFENLQPCLGGQRSAHPGGVVQVSQV